MQMPAGEVRLAELLGSLSLAIDLGLGLPSEWMLKSALVSARLACALGHDEAAQRTAYYLALVRNVGCTSTSAHDALLFGDELAQAELMTADPDDGLGIMQLLGRTVGPGHSLVVRAAMIGRLMWEIGRGGMVDNHMQHCEGAAILAERMGLGTEVQAALWHTYERWDGRGTPKRVAGDALHPAARIVHVASLAAHFHTIGGIEPAMAVVRQRSGKALDPQAVEGFCAAADAVLADVEAPTLATVLAAEPGEHTVLSPAALELALQAIADFADQKTPHTLGHSRRVAALADAAGRLSGLPAGDIDWVRHAAYVHDIGRVGVSAALLTKTGPLSPGEWERVRMHPYFTERVFSQSNALRELAALGAMHHEKLDGTGYHRGLAGPMLPAAARLLIAANAYAALTEDRPHRPRLAPTEAEKALMAEVQAGRLDKRAVEAVLGAAGHRVPSSRRAQAIQLSERELEVLRLLAQQLSNKQIARKLGISPKTVEHHVSSIFNKIGVETRTGAALFATHNDLL
jgi:HD-GYP domain-containing protein (c-di-GMP phosphodiesterase class II)